MCEPIMFKAILDKLENINYNSDQGANDFVRCLDHLRNVCYKHINLRIVFGVMFTELILVYYLIEN